MNANVIVLIDLAIFIETTHDWASQVCTALALKANLYRNRSWL